jgi:hypothetical protein
MPRRALTIVGALAVLGSAPAASQGLPPGCRLAPQRYLRISDNTGARELVIEVGPVDVPAHSMAPHQRELTYQLTFVPLTAWINGFRVEVVDLSGKALPRWLLHHIVTARPASRELFLPVTQRFVGIGIETRALRLPAWLAGAALRRGEPLLVNTMFHNPTDTDYHGVRVKLVFAYSHTRPLYEISPFNLDVMFPIGSKEFDLPPGRTVRVWEGSPAVAARILVLGGHLHRYAQWAELVDLTTGAVIWRVRPETDRSGAVTRIPMHVPRLGLGRVIDPAHRYRLTAVYANSTGRTIPRGGMAKIGGLVVPANGAHWPSVDLGDSLYRQDLRRLLRHQCGFEGPEEEMMMHAP